MSFFNNCHSDKCPGNIKGNPLCGLCEKVCIQAKKVFDACIKQMSYEDQIVTLTDVTPNNYVEPLTFVSAKNTTARGTVTNLQIDRLEDRPKFARVRADIVIPFEVIFADSTGALFKGQTSITVSEDVILMVPSPSIIPYEIEAVTGLIGPEGTWISGLTFELTACLTIILKVVVEVELLLPSYGYCTLPPCQEYNQEVCTSFFELPVFPTSDL